ncbi:GtrA family protein, partial [Cupriavidus sp. 2MCAB6]|uniref:GtrA family protein n=1 Tax=Cupriavidus sp. 2MCAB6 TaxID=3232981 RepID=UPI003F901119
LNSRITFAGCRGKLATAFGRYLLSQYIGFGFNIIIYTAMLKFNPSPFNLPLFCIVVASGAALAINYIGSRSFVFVDRRP